MFFRISSISAARSHAGLIFRTVNKTFWAFFGAWGRDRSRSPPCGKNVDFFRVKQIQQSTASMRTSGYCLTNIQESLHKWCVNAGRLSAKSGHHQASIASAPQECEYRLWVKPVKAYTLTYKGVNNGYGLSRLKLTRWPTRVWISVMD